MLIVMKFDFSSILGNMKPSEIRELLKYASSPDIISFGGGMPNPQTFPIEDIKSIIDDVLEESGRYALQYGSTAGLYDLLIEIKKMVKRTENISIEEKEIIVTSGSQQALYALGKIFVNPGETVITEAPTYVGAISAFNANLVNMEGVDLDENGMNTDALQQKLDELKGKGVKPKFIYTIPTFQNPAGYTMSLERRKHIIDISEDYQIPLVEDNPYGELRYSGTKLPSIKSLDKNNSVTYLGTFSKVMTPGLRIGYTLGPLEVVNKINLLKQSLDLATNTLSQFVAFEYLKRKIMDKQIPKTVELYRKKRDIMLKALSDYFPKGSNWSVPDGGMFIWATLDKRINTTEMLLEAIRKNVAYVSGGSFYPKGEKRNGMRLNFTYPEDDQLVEGIRRLGETASARLKALEASA